jgi:uncharacterized pyridoxal phosphate-dependent enzyme
MNASSDWINDKNIIYKNLGIEPLINAQGTYTTLGGSLMPPEVLQAMTEAAGWFVSIAELQEKVGARIAALLEVPSAMVTAGAASAITVATAACMVREKPESLERLPDIAGLRNEVIIQKAHKCGYEPQMLLVGAKLIWVETLSELEKAINARTAMPFFLNRYEPLGQIMRHDWVRVGKEHAVPVFNDAAADLPPVSRLWEYYHQGFDLVAFSGGKGLQGPQASGLLLGRADLIAAGRRVISPQMGIGRGMKVGKEEIIGLLAALERFLSMDHDAQWRLWETRVAGMIDVLQGIPGINLRRDVPEIANHSPHLLIEWSRWHVPLSAAEVVRHLRDGDPPIAALVEHEQGMRVAIWTLRADEHRIVATRIREILTDTKS